MPELPEVHTTVSGINKNLIGLKIIDVWSDYFSKSLLYKNKQIIKNKNYFKKTFKPLVKGTKIKIAHRRGKNILIDLSNKQTLIIHMKMTGHLLYGKYKKGYKDKNIEERTEVWQPIDDGPLQDPFNQHIHLVFSLSNNRHLVLSDVRKFAKVLVVKTALIDKHPDIKDLGPEPLEKSFTFNEFKNQIFKKPNLAIKQVLMDQKILAGIGNIYSDEILWKVGLSPKTYIKKIESDKLKLIFKEIKVILKEGINFGGDSTSDYRNIYGEKGAYQKIHKVYRRTGKPCLKKNCRGTIIKMKLGGRSAHYCDNHQKHV